MPAPRRFLGIVISLAVIPAENMPTRLTMFIDNLENSSRTIVASTSQAPPPRHYDTNSQTQDETQFVLPSAHTSKRKSSNRSEVQPSKKVKISVGPAVDLQD